MYQVFSWDFVAFFATIIRALYYYTTLTFNQLVECLGIVDEQKGYSGTEMFTVKLAMALASGDLVVMNFVCVVCIHFHPLLDYRYYGKGVLSLHCTKPTRYDDDKCDG